jgi:hypothetical protein
VSRTFFAVRKWLTAKKLFPVVGTIPIQMQPWDKSKLNTSHIVFSIGLTSSTFVIRSFMIIFGP